MADHGTELNTGRKNLTIKSFGNEADLEAIMFILFSMYTS